jgi:hypothetical protein
MCTVPVTKEPNTMDIAPTEPTRIAEPHHLAASRCAAALDRLAELLREACNVARCETPEDAGLVDRMLIEPARIAAARGLNDLAVVSIGLTPLPFACSAEAAIIDLGLDGASHADALAEQVRAWARGAVSL